MQDSLMETDQLQHLSLIIGTEKVLLTGRKCSNLMAELCKHLEETASLLLTEYPRLFTGTDTVSEPTSSPVPLPARSAATSCDISTTTPPGTHFQLPTVVLSVQNENFNVYGIRDNQNTTVEPVIGGMEDLSISEPAEKIHQPHTSHDMAKNTSISLSRQLTHHISKSLPSTSAVGNAPDLPVSEEDWGSEVADSTRPAFNFGMDQFKHISTAVNNIVAAASTQAMEWKRLAANKSIKKIRKEMFSAPTAHSARPQVDGEFKERYCNKDIRLYEENNVVTDQYLTVEPKTDIVTAGKTDIVTAGKTDIVTAGKTDIVTAGKTDIVTAGGQANLAGGCKINNNVDAGINLPAAPSLHLTPTQQATNIAMPAVHKPQNHGWQTSNSHRFELPIIKHGASLSETPADVKSQVVTSHFLPSHVQDKCEDNSFHSGMERGDFFQRSNQLDTKWKAASSCRENWERANDNNWRQGCYVDPAAPTFQSFGTVTRSVYSPQDLLVLSKCKASRTYSDNIFIQPMELNVTDIIISPSSGNWVCRKYFVPEKFQLGSPDAFIDLSDCNNRLKQSRAKAWQRVE